MSPATPENKVMGEWRDRRTLCRYTEDKKTIQVANIAPAIRRTWRQLRAQCCPLQQHARHTVQLMLMQRHL